MIPPGSDSGEDALRREVLDASDEEERRAERLTRRWRRFLRNLRVLTDGPDE